MALVEILAIVIMFVVVFFSIVQKDMLYDAKKGCYYISDVDKEYKYKLELSGVLPNENQVRKIIVYANESSLTFDDVVWLAYSGESEDNNEIFIDLKKM